MIDPITFCQQLKLKNGKPLLPLAWQKALITAATSGQYREVFCMVPRKNGKTVICASLALWFLLCREQGSEIYIAASTRDQSSILFRECMSMVQQSPALRKRCKIRASKKEISYGSSFIRACSSDVRSTIGSNPSVFIADEISWWRNRELFDVLWSGQGQRVNPIAISITTSSDNQQSFAYEKYEYAKRVISGEVTDPTFFPLIFSGDNLDMESVRKANPSIGHCVQLDYLEKELAKAQRDPAHEILFRWSHLNQWVSSTKSWLDAGQVKAAQIDKLPERGETYAIGVDLSAVLDLSCYAVAWKADDGITYIDPQIYIPTKMAKEYEKKFGIPYRKWRDEGWINWQEGNAIDPIQIREDLVTRFPNSHKILVDRILAAETILFLSSAGQNVQTMGQGYMSMSPAAKEFWRLIATGKVRWANPIMTWCALHAEISVDPTGSIKPCKPGNSGSYKKIDPLISTIMAISGLDNMDYAAPAIQWT